jgi:hypothetical protein
MSFRPNLPFRGMGIIFIVFLYQGFLVQCEMGGLKPPSISILSPNMKEYLALNLHVHQI